MREKKELLASGFGKTDLTLQCCWQGREAKWKQNQIIKTKKITVKENHVS